MIFYNIRGIDSQTEDSMAEELLNATISTYKKHLQKRGEANLERLMEDHLRVMLRFKVETNFNARLETTFKEIDAIVGKGAQ